MASYTYIAQNTELAAYLKRLKERGVKEVALDLEGEFNLHVYGERFCLLQLYDGEEEVVVDPFTVAGDLMRDLLENRNLLKITYDSTSDRVLLAKTHGIVMNSILDLRPAVELLDFERNDLSSVLGESLGLAAPGSKKRFQQYDWTKRPIDPAAIEYAIRDVRHLFELKDALLERLVRGGRLEEYILENLKRQDRPPETDRKPGVFRSGRHRRLTPSQQKEFQRLYDIRDRHARELDLPPNTVISNNDLFALAADEISTADVTGNRRLPPDRLTRIIAEISRS